MHGRHISAGSDRGSFDIEALHADGSGRTLAMMRNAGACLHHAVVHVEDHSVHRGEFLEACRVGRGGPALR
jgi:hypothetical protein